MQIIDSSYYARSPEGNGISHISELKAIAAKIVLTEPSPLHQRPIVCGLSREIVEMTQVAELERIKPCGFRLANNFHKSHHWASLREKRLSGEMEIQELNDALGCVGQLGGVIERRGRSVVRP
jgi:hypothetical protein